MLAEFREDYTKYKKYYEADVMEIGGAFQNQLNAQNEFGKKVKLFVWAAAIAYYLLYKMFFE